MNIKKKIYEIARNKLKKELTNHLGEVEETSDKLICHVKKSILKSKKFNETLFCYGISYNDIKLAKAYNLNKQIYYVFNGLSRRNQQLHIDGCYNSKIIIEESNLENSLLDISTDGKLVINNSTLMGNLYFSLYAKDLELNECIIKFALYCKDITYDICGENSIKVKDSMVGNSRVNLDFRTPNLTLDNNNIVGKNIDIREVKNLICDDGNTITAEESVNIEADTINQIDVYAPNITIDGSEYKTQFKRKQFNEEIDQKRCELLDLLAIIRDKYFKKYNNILANKKDELYSEPLGRSLKK